MRGSKTVSVGDGKKKEQRPKAMHTYIKRVFISQCCNKSELRVAKTGPDCFLHFGTK